MKTESEFQDAIKKLKTVRQSAVNYKAILDSLNKKASEEDKLEASKKEAQSKLLASISELEKMLAEFRKCDESDEPLMHCFYRKYQASIVETSRFLNKIKKELGEIAGKPILELTEYTFVYQASDGNDYQSIMVNLRIEKTSASRKPKPLLFSYGGNPKTLRITCGGDLEQARDSLIGAGCFGERLDRLMLLRIIPEQETTSVAFSTIIAAEKKAKAKEKEKKEAQGSQNTITKELSPSSSQSHLR